MTHKLMVGAALGALMVSGAMAQSPNAPSPSTSSPPAATAPSDSMTTSKPDFVNTQKPDQWLASKFKGTTVIGSDNEKIGDVSDILFDKTGKIEAYVVSVGGFLGMGAKEVAMTPNAFEVVPASSHESLKLKTALTKDQLKSAQNFARYEPPRPAATTGSAPGSTGSPRPSSPMGR